MSPRRRARAVVRAEAASSLLHRLRRDRLRDQGADPRVYYPFVVLLRQFWPGLALLPFAIRRALRSEDRTRRAVLVACAVGTLIACLPHRKLPHHLGVLYPLAALVAGEALGAGLAWFAARPDESWRKGRAIVGWTWWTRESR